MGVSTAIIHMQVAGWGGAGNVMGVGSVMGSRNAVLYSNMKIGGAYTVGAIALDDGIMSTTINLFNRRVRTVDSGAIVTPLELLKAFDAASQKVLASSRFVREMHALTVSDELTKLLSDFTEVLGSGSKAWAVVIQCLSENFSSQYNISRHAERLLRHFLKDEDTVILKELRKRFTDVIGTVQLNAS